MIWQFWALSNAGPRGYVAQRLCRDPHLYRPAVDHRDDMRLAARQHSSRKTERRDADPGIFGKLTSALRVGMVDGF